MGGDRAVVFDLDQTLVDSSALEPFRRARDWRAIYPRIEKLQCYDGLADLLRSLREQHVRLAVVTSSPHTYCSRVLKTCAVEIDACVCYHDTKRHKPDPEPLLLALKRLGEVDPTNAVAVGDVAADILAARAAGICAIAATWGCSDIETLQKSKPDYLVSDVDALRSVIYDRFGLEG